MFSVHYDDTSGIIRCTSGGFLTVAEVHEYASAVHESMGRSWREFGRVAMLVISNDATVQSAEVMDATNANLRRFGPADRLAIVVSSQLVKMQAGRTLDGERFRTFASEEEALAWLIAEMPARHTAVRRAASA